MDRREIMVEACSGAAFEVYAGDEITIVDLEGGQVVDFFALADEAEFLSPGVTIDCNSSLRLCIGNKVYTNAYNPMFELIADDVGEHDLLHPCCSKAMYDFFYFNGEGHPSCLGNINAALSRYGFSKRPIIHPINLFMRTLIGPVGEVTVEAPRSRAGDRVVLRALTCAIVAIAACSVVESECNGGRATPVKAIIERK